MKNNYEFKITNYGNLCKSKHTAIFGNTYIGGFKSLFIMLLVITIWSLSGVKAQAQNNVGIGTTTPNPKAILELNATDKGFIAPRLTTPQMLAIAPTATENALLIYNTDSACYHFYNGTAWKNLCQKGLDTALINKAIKNYLNTNSTTIINILKGDTSIFNVTTINNAYINNLTVDTSITNVAIISYADINLLKVDSSTTNYAQISHLQGGWGSMDSLQIGGQNIMQTISDSITAQAWLLKGNNANANNKLGTLNARDLHIITNNTEAITIANGTRNVGIAQLLPAEKLDVTGNLKFTGTLKPAGLAGNNGEVLTSTGNTTAPVWQPISTILNSSTTTTMNVVNIDSSTTNVANVNVLIADTSILNYITINNAVIDSSTTNVANVNILTADTSILNYANINNAIIDSSKTNYADINILKGDSATLNYLSVGGQNIMQTMTDSIKSQAWLLKGNAGTTAGTNFLGTTDNVDLVFKRNNVQSGLISDLARNTSFGYSALNPATIGGGNTAMGYTALDSNTTGNLNTAIGFRALQGNTTGLQNTSYGYGSMLQNSLGSYNTALGEEALRNSNGDRNTAIGRASLNTNTIGSNNTAIGYQADVTLNNLINATAIGYNAKVGTSNSLVLGGTGVDAVNVGIGTATPLYKLEVADPASASIQVGTGGFGVGGALLLGNPNHGIIRGASGATLGFTPLSNDVTMFTSGASVATGGNLYLATDVVGGTAIPRLTVAPTGNVGIGTTTPLARFTLRQVNSGWLDGIRLENAAGVNAYTILNDNSSAYLSIAANNDYNKSIVLEGITGNVGVGTNAPAGKLHIKLGDIIKETSTGYDGTWDNVIKYMANNDPIIHPNRWIGIDATVTASSAAANKMKFRLYPGTVLDPLPIDVMTLQGDGNVGIGTATPTQKLQVENGNILVNQGSLISVQSSTTGILGNLQMQGKNTSAGMPNLSQYTLYNMSDYSGVYNGLSIWEYYDANNDGLFCTAGDICQSRFDIQRGTGNVGINTFNPTEKLEVQGSVKIVDGTQGIGKVLTSDAAGKASWQSPAGAVLSSYNITAHSNAANGATYVLPGFSYTVTKAGNYRIEFRCWNSFAGGAPGIAVAEHIRLLQNGVPADQYEAYCTLGSNTATTTFTTFMHATACAVGDVLTLDFRGGITGGATTIDFNNSNPWTTSKVLVYPE